MFNLARPLLFAFYAAAFLTFFGSPLYSLYAVASPLPIVTSSRSPAPPARILDSTTPSIVALPRNDLLSDLSGGPLLQIQCLVTKIQPLIDSLANLLAEECDTKCSLILGSLSSLLHNLKTLLQPLAYKKGLAFFNPNNDLHKLLKVLVNYLKMLLNALVPPRETCPTLSEIVDDIKCIIIDILDLCENVLDAAT